MRGGVLRAVRVLGKTAKRIAHFGCREQPCGTSARLLSASGAADRAAAGAEILGKESIHHMDEKKRREETLEQRDEAVLPEGWRDGDDLFAPETWSGGAAASDDPEQDEARPDEPLRPTTAPAEPPEQSGAADEPQRIRFRARVDHADRDVELDPEQLPELWQKAQITERAQARLRENERLMAQLDRLSRMFSYSDPQSLLSEVERAQLQRRADALAHSGMPPELAMEMAELLAERRAGGLQAPAPAAPPERSYLGELSELLDVCPELRGQRLPEEVVRAAVSGGCSLLSAWQRHSAAQARMENERLREENRILRQNADMALRAPVRGAAGGPEAGTPQSEFERSFLRGFEAGW